jgi:hypothetical protein
VEGAYVAVVDDEEVEGEAGCVVEVKVCYFVGVEGRNGAAVGDGSLRGVYDDVAAAVVADGGADDDPPSVAFEVVERDGRIEHS